MTIQDLKSMVRASGNIVFFGGAGVSTESNIPDFRSADGIYNKGPKYKYSPEYMLSHEFLMDHTEEFFDFYKRDIIHREARPNKAHLALKELEDMGKLKAIITQNIDGLHQMAGSKNVLELHGGISENYCISCGSEYDLDYIMKEEPVPSCEKCGSLVRPRVVLYGEGLDMDLMDRSIDYISKADILIVGGTSLSVYPAAGLIQYYRGDKLILINKSQTQYDNRARLTFNERIGRVLSEMLED